MAASEKSSVTVVLPVSDVESEVSFLSVRPLLCSSFLRRCEMTSTMAMVKEITANGTATPMAIFVDVGNVSLLALCAEPGAPDAVASEAAAEIVETTTITFGVPALVMAVVRMVVGAGVADVKPGAPELAVTVVRTVARAAVAELTREAVTVDVSMTVE